ncbi:hypothetical protein JCM5350_005413 [Sporobolomyces pararoseus]
MLQQQQTPIESSESRNHRAAPGRRGPVPTSCDRCRKLRVKCIRKLGGRLGEETCTQCEKRSAECTVSNEINHSRKAVTPRSRSTSLAISPPAEQSIIRRQVSGAKANRFFDLYVTTLGTANFIPLCIHDAFKLRTRFEDSGKDFDKLDQDDQLRCRLVFAAAATRFRSIEANEDGSTAIDLFKTAQEAADELAIWRRPTRPNLASLLLLFYLAASGELTSLEAKYYFSAACSHFSILFPTFDSIHNSTFEWGAYTVPLIDVVVALESRSSPTLTDRSQRDIAVLSHDKVPNYLPPPGLLASFLPNHPAKVVALCSQSVTYYVYTARLLAYRIAESFEEDLPQEDFDVLEQVWTRLDRYNAWATECLALANTSTAEGDASMTLSALKSAFVVIWMPCILLDFYALSYLRDRVTALQNDSNDYHQAPLDSTKLRSYTSLHSIASSRCTRVLCALLRLTRNQKGIYLLVATAGHEFSISRIRDLALILLEADVDDWDLFPLGLSDKLASVTFLLKSIKSAQEANPRSDITESIEALTFQQQELEIQTGYSGESALSLFTSIPLNSSSEGPDAASPGLTEAEASIYRGVGP